MIHSTDNTISSNNITKQGQYGLLLNVSSNNRIQDNHISTQTTNTGIHLVDSSDNTITGNAIGYLGNSSTLAEAVDNYAFPWSTGGDANWFYQTETFHYDGDAAESGDIGHNEYTYLQTTIEVTDPGTLSFYWKVSSEEGNDYLEFWLDGTQRDRISGVGP